MDQLFLFNLAEIIHDQLEEEFAEVFLSGNLRDTAKIGVTPNGAMVEIPAKMYDLMQFRKEGVIIYTGEGSYAQQVDITGGFSGLHKGYIDKRIERAIAWWARKNNLNVRVRYE